MKHGRKNSTSLPVTRSRHVLQVLVCLMLTLLAASRVAAQDVTSRYVYDEKGRLRAVIAPNGEAAVYEYDAAGNFTAIRRLAANALELLDFAPRFGLPGTLVNFYGVGFGDGVSAVSFNGATGTVISFTNSLLIAQVPAGATTGLVTITTPRGTLTTTAPFTVQGISLSPLTVTLLPGATQQFTAQTVLPGENQQLRWSVNGVTGGNEGFGLITSDGLYTAALAPPVTFEATIRATSVAFPNISAFARVRVLSFDDARFALSPGVAVGKGADYAFGAFSPGVAIGKGADYTFGAFSPSVAVSKGDNFTGTFSSGVSVGKGERFIYGAAISPSVSLTKGPVITSITPATLRQGTNTSVTLNGTNFTGANSVRVVNQDGSLASGVTASNISVNGNGSTLTVQLAVTSSAALGRRLVVVATPTAHSASTDVNVNTVQITAP